MASNKARHAFGKLSNLDSAIEQKIVDSYDILFMTDENDKAVIGWVDASGNPVIVTDEKADLTELEASVSELETELSAKANAEEVEAKINEAVADVLTETQTYVDEQIAKSESTIEIVEF